jgi:hypothetical protein
MEQDLICKKCGLVVGKLDADGVVLTIGESLFFNETRFSHSCGKAFRFKPIEPRDLSTIKGYTQEILINLGKTKKVRGN